MLFWKILGWILLKIPASWMELLASSLYALGGPFLGKERRTIMINAVRVLSQTPTEARHFARTVLKSQFLVYIDTIAYVLKRDAVLIEGKEEFFQAVKALQTSEKGLVVFTAHLGSWELAGHFCALATQKPMHVLAKPSKTTWVNPLLQKIRERLEMNVLWTDSKSLYRDMLTALDKGEGLGFVMDQKPATKTGGHDVDFLGIPNTPIVQGPALMLAKKNVAAVGAYCVRVGPRRFRLIASVALPAMHGEIDQVKISACLAKNMEHVILQFPEQWAWNYRRWKF